MAFIIGAVKLCDGSKTMLALFQGTPEIIYIQTDRGDRTHTGNYNSSTHHLPLSFYAAIKGPFRRPQR